MKDHALKIAEMLNILITNPNDGTVTFSVEALKEIEEVLMRACKEIEKLKHEKV